MNKALSLAGGALAASLLASATASANEELLMMQANPADWAMPTGDYKNQRYSALAQIDKGNVGDLKVAWTF